METSRSADGTGIAYEVEGRGPGLVIATGAFCDRGTTADLAALLADRYTVVRYDRRGRGDSGDSDVYAVEREIEDLAAVLATTDGRAFVYGHSSGAALVLLAAAAGVPMRKLAVYEPPYSLDLHPVDALRDGLAAALQAGDRAGAVKLFLRDAIGLPPEVVATAEHWPDWAGMLGIAHTLPYDLAIVGAGVVPPQLAGIAVPTLVLHGGNSTNWVGDDHIVPVVPGARGLVVEGQDHGVAADAVAPVLAQFFS